MSSTPALRYRDLRVRYPTTAGYTHALDHVSFDVPVGGCVGIVGESGSGKTQLALAAIGLLPRSAVVSGGIELGSLNLLTLEPKGWRAVRGRVIVTIFQDPMSSLTPHLRIGSQLREVLGYHRDIHGEAAHHELVRMLDSVQVARGEQRLRQYPYELSGGTLQRIAIAMALLSEPRILIADEPTASLDATTRLGILKLLNEVRRRDEMSVILISHDLRVVERVADRVIVLYAGRVAEHGTVSSILGACRHPYTVGLLGSAPIAGRPHRSRLDAIAGEPTLGRPPEPGCSFWPRCSVAGPRCLVERPQLRRVTAHSDAACHMVPGWEG
jgi:oligopeptide transport system ATP-binding protein